MGTMKQTRLRLACALAVITVAPVEAQVQEIVLHNFKSGGYYPPAGVTLAPDGIYGTAASGGTGYEGVVYKLDKAFHYTVLHSFTAIADGVSPIGGVIRDPAGNLYGTTPTGGTGDDGVVYKLDSAGNYTVLYNFTGETGEFPQDGVIRDSAGNLYGTAYSCVFELDVAGNYTVLYNFTDGGDGTGPYGGPSGGLVRDSAGSFYGTTSTLGGRGVVYRLDADGGYKVLHHFTEEFTNPNGVILTPDGLYGSAQGRTTNYGMLYKLDYAGNYTVLYNFTGGTDGEYPVSGVIRDSAGNLYGTAGGGTGGWGVVYKLDSAGNYTVLYNFTGGADGGDPSGVVLGPAGNLIGTTQYGGSDGVGVVFLLTGVQ
jgi:uncharacterized repeat protein (TIGR03803 family)